MLLLLTVAGCGGGNSINEYYGQRGGMGANSVNGTAVLGEMFEGAGHRVRSVRALYPKVADTDAIVWFCEDFRAPSPAARAWLNGWLSGGGAKTLVYVSRDYEAGPLYWREAAKLAPAAQQGEYNKRLRESTSDAAARRSGAPLTDDDGEWLSLDPRNPLRRVQQLTGPWADGVNAKQCDIEHRAYLTPGARATVLLADGQGRPLVSEITARSSGWLGSWPGGQTPFFPPGAGSRLLLVENGSFLLNAALVNPEHRKLAARLVDSVGPPEQRVVFLESGGSPPIRESDPSDTPRSGLEMLGVWPIGAILAQAIALGVVYAASRWPIFGRPRSAEQPSLTDFRRHVTAVGRLLAATRDHAYAESKLRAYFLGGRDKD